MRDRQSLTRELLRAVRFVLVGLFNTANYTALYAGLVLAGVPYVAASIIAYVIAISVAYWLNHRFTFRVADHSKRLAASFFAVQAGAAVVNIILLAAVVEGLGWSPIVAQLVIMPPVVLSTFGLNRFVVFGAHVDTRVSRETPDESAAGTGASNPTRSSTR